MSNSDVLARKYRPKNFEDLIGQESISQTLSLALDSNRLSHAYLFSGLRGSGKTSTARIFSKALICEKGPTSVPCEMCEHCQMANEGRHIDIIEMDAASSRKIDDIRDLIEQTKYKPSQARFKIFIIDEVHMLTKEAFNALLKTLEEPPSFVKFILATTDALKLPPTILSRTQHFRFKKISQNHITNHLIHLINLENQELESQAKTPIEYTNDALDILARSGAGSLRDTLTLLDQAIIYSKNSIDITTVSNMLGLVNPDFLDTLFQTIFTQDAKALTKLIAELEVYEAEMVIDEIIAFLKEKLFTSDAKFSPLTIERFFRILSDSKTLFTINADGTFILSLTLFKMVEALKVKELDELIEEMESRVQEGVAVNAVSLPITKPQTPTPVQESKPIEVSKPQTEQLFDTLIEKLLDRNAELGECFQTHITFVSYENNTLTWMSCAPETCKEKLRHGYSVIKHFVQEIFGVETKIALKACDKEPTPEEPKSKQTPTSPPVDEYIQEVQPVEPAKETTKQEDISGSCATPMLNAQNIDAKTMLESEMLQKAKELFEPNNITVQQKV